MVCRYMLDLGFIYIIIGLVEACDLLSHTLYIFGGYELHIFTLVFWSDNADPFAQLHAYILHLCVNMMYGCIGVPYNQYNCIKMSPLGPVCILNCSIIV